MHELTGERVTLTNGFRGTITDIRDRTIYVTAYGKEYRFRYPDALSGNLVLENEDLREKYRNMGSISDFESFRQVYRGAVGKEIQYLKSTGGKHYRAIDGTRIPEYKNAFVYSFDTDQELHFPEDTALRIYREDGIIFAYVVSCDDFAIVIRAEESLGNNLTSIEFSAEQWHLLEALDTRLAELKVSPNGMAYQLACCGKKHIREMKHIQSGQNQAMVMAESQPITFIWGPPGTGKTKTLTDIAAAAIRSGERVLMLSYSNVSVDEALLRLASKMEQKPGQIVRYGNARKPELLAKSELTSYGYILSQYPVEKATYDALIKMRNALPRKSKERTDLTVKINGLEKKLRDREKELIHRSAFIATTVSKAVIDEAVYSQKFDVVMFDEASMAYVPQIVFAASLAKSHFCCLGDFRQLPAIVQSDDAELLSEDIFAHCGITSAVEHEYGHDWLVMLNLQHRMHKEIADFAGAFMYNKLLVTDSNIMPGRQKVAEDCKPGAGSPIIMADISKSYSVCMRTMDGSHVNLMSALICMKIAEELKDYYDVGIISPYSAQARLILAMIRDLREKDDTYNHVDSQTVHQFQGSEKPVIIYDAVDCYRITFPGMLLTSLKNDQANRLFNVAMTRAEGKFILVANKDYLYRKNISQKLMFVQAIRTLEKQQRILNCEELIDEIGTFEEETPKVFFGMCDEEDSWNRYIHDIESAKKTIRIDVPGNIDDDIKAIETLAAAMKAAAARGVRVTVRAESADMVPESIRSYYKQENYVTTPITVIDRAVIWYGEPLCIANFISEGKELVTEYYPCLRFRGAKTARMLEALLG